MKLILYFTRKINEKIYIFIVIALLFSACSTLKVETDYDISHDFTKNHTYAVVYNVKEGDNTLINKVVSKVLKDFPKAGI